MGFTPAETGSAETPDVLIVGAGMAGLGMAIELLRAGMSDFVVLEKADGVGGTWRENTYPGCACDVASVMYSYSFAPSRKWSRMYARQPEILDYIGTVAKDHELEPFIRFGTEAVSYEFDEADDRWRVRTRSGQEYRPRIVVLAHGALHLPNIPDFPGMARFKGPIFHSALWDDSVELAGKRVAVIGTGASAVQFIPEIAGIAAHVDVYQRNAHWMLPKADRPFKTWEHRLFRTLPFTQWLYRNVAYWTHELPVLAFLNPRFVKILEVASRRMLDKQVPDPELRAKLTPRYKIGCKRILLSNDYYPALLRPDVDLVTDGVAEFTETGVRTASGEVREADVVILGTGFRTHNRCADIPITGRDGLTIQEAWRDGMTAYLGMTVAGMPNMFMIMGPNSGGGAQSILFVIESQLHYIVECLRMMKARRATRLEVRAEVQRRFNAWLHGKLNRSVWNTGGCHSWFLDHTGHNRHSWPGTGTSYWKATRRPDPRAFILSGSRAGRDAQGAPRVDAPPRAGSSTGGQ
ncbi:NAD(P)/FAD-dependent oxidoreductase [Microbispora sp. H10836]|uniref:flavin-containing monooxygenase n=1 Tax=Microbispora sp. H10836 TaxID=2729106 RepID=UPI00147596F1|nr:NAD(P)/FAD-dependent oxidoreductase [Microbispora sp. H10836]